MIEEILMDAQERMEKSIDRLKEDLSHIRTGKANVSLLNGIMVEYYGTPTPINQVANVSAPAPDMITVQPWDKGIIKDIEKAIQKSDLGINPNNDGVIIRLPLPQLTKETRTELAKQARKKGEDAKIHIRNIRRDANDSVKKLEKAKEITEDDSKGAQDDVQKETDAAVARIDKICEEKEKDIMSI
ncbi:MAG: ribosome recycling factor [Peptococcaceae bacterium]|nr:ribosome recycling factor [Peptococcaceae bacterium]